MNSIAQLNQLSQPEFVEVLGAIFEDTPAIAHQVWHQRPFKDVTDLHQKMIAVVNDMTQVEQLTLIKAHPDLGSKTKMAEASVKEQSGVGLDRLTREEYNQFQALNQAYKDRFGFPFIVAVKNHTKQTILEAFDRRLHHSFELEITQALTEIFEIARFRLHDLID
ncbi:2-oxo-4-hydroxy-4-carboxy-5-ureidoimidazoline decarboxylase [Phormidesmis sp. 146-35]